MRDKDATIAKLTRENEALKAGETPSSSSSSSADSADRAERIERTLAAIRRNREQAKSTAATNAKPAPPTSRVAPQAGPSTIPARGGAAQKPAAKARNLTGREKAVAAFNRQIEQGRKSASTGIKAEIEKRVKIQAAAGNLNGLRMPSDAEAKRAQEKLHGLVKYEAELCQKMGVPSIKNMLPFKERREVEAASART